MSEDRKARESERVSEPHETPTGEKPITQGAPARQPGNAARRVRPDPPQTLVNLYLDKRAKPADLLKFLAQRDLFATPDDDQIAALALLSERDPELIKTKSLALEVANAYEGRFTAAFDRFLSSSVESQFREVSGWPPNAEVAASQSLHQVVDNHRSELIKKEPRKRLFNALMIAQAVLSSRYGLQIQEVLPALSHALVASRPGRKRPTALGHPALTIQLLRLWLEILSPWIETAAKDAKRADRAELAELDLERLLQEANGRMAQLEDAIGTATSELDDLREELRSAKLARQLENSQLRGSLAGFLENDIGACLQSIREALGLEPPRLTYSLQRLDDAEHAIQGKVKWLRSSA